MKQNCQILLILLLPFAGCSSDKQASEYTGVLEGTTVQVSALIGGKIVQMQAIEGREVTQGDTLAQVDATEWMLQMKEHHALLDELTIQNKQAKTAMNRAHLDLDYLQQKYNRIKLLQAREATPQQNVDDLKNRVQHAQLALLSAQQQVQGLAAKRQQLLVQKETIQKKIHDATVVAPIDGLVETRYFEPGEAVPPLQAVVQLLQVRELEVKVYIPETMLPKIKVGQTVTLHIDGLNRELKGQVRWLSHKAEFTPKTVLTPETRASLVYAVKVVVQNPERILKHGMPAQVVF